MPDLLIILFLMLAAFSAGWVDAIGGGGGLIHLPALLFGLPNASPAELLGTNKASQVFGTASATATYYQKMPHQIKSKYYMALFGFVGSIFGAIFSSNLPRQAFEPIVFVILIIVGSWMLLKPELKAAKKISKNSRLLVSSLAGLGIGFYDGAFGPGTGAFLIAIFVGVLGEKYLNATAGAKVVNLASNGGAILVFALSGSILWKLVFILSITNICGGYFGAKTAIGRGSKFVQVIVATVAFASAIRLGFKIWG
jgi:hypothetical protein